jgi:hypothetical protein
MNALIQRRDFKDARTYQLPFCGNVSKNKRKKDYHYWQVPHTDDYGDACAEGYQFACDYLQFLKQNPAMRGMNMLGHIVDAIPKREIGDANNGYAVGFLSFFDEMLAAAAQNFDFYRHADHRLAQMNRVRAERDLETEIEGETA